jgi:uncharacterized protein (DUF697 family)
LDIYEKSVLKRGRFFELRLYESSEFQGWAKNIQQKLDGLIPRKIHLSLSYALEKGIKGFLEGLHYILKENDRLTPSTYIPSLHILAQDAEKIVQKYKKIASVEGAGTGFGGLIASAIDFPALITIKLKMLQEISLLFGYSLTDFEERLYIVKVLQLEFSSKEFKKKYWAELKQWTELQDGLASKTHSWKTFDWEEFYMEYKQSIELAKLFQMIPGLGAIVGAWANYSFLEDLGETAILCYELRYLQEKYGEEIAW